ncbi:MAG: SusD/RagB family nutrient-binding outer membrane lipoprotein, partial [Gemmatimonadota bacterium]|nr:SusD/RagB family nutrient-binding outer membrane lipoprotein [Gemmatimonadota bacterium]
SNSLRARHAMRLVNVDPATARAEFVAAFGAPNGLMASNADNAQFSWPGDGVYDNPWAVNFRTRDDHRMSNVIMNILIPTADPRLPVYAQPTPANPAVYAGMPNALTHNNAQVFFNTASRPGAVFYSGATTYGTFGGAGSTWPSFLMTYAEVSFLKAEAAERGWIAGSAATFYEEGIRSSMAQWNVTNAAAINAYVASAPIAYAGGTAGLARIATQKWLALYTDGGQAWMEWRRTCVPSTIKPGPDALIGTVPRRLQYSLTENAVNAENVSAATGRQGADVFTTRMYWDKSPTVAPTFVVGCGQR